MQAGSLAIISQQDASTFKSKQTNIGLSVSADFGNKPAPAANGTQGGRPFGGAGASVSFGQTKQSGDFASVQEQSGITAGAGGFDIRVAGATTLTGGVIASTAEAANNQLTTGTLSATDLQNREKFKASSINLSASISGIGRPSTTTPPAGTNTGTGTPPPGGTSNSAQVPTGPTGEPTQSGNRTGTTAGLATRFGTIAAGAPSVASASGSQSSTTVSAIAQGGITITSGDAASLGVAQTISRNTSAANEALTKQFTETKRADIAEGFAATQALTQQVSVFFNNRAREEATLRDQAEGLTKKDADGKAIRDPLTGRYLPADGLSVAQVRALGELNTSIEGYRTFGAGGTARIIATALTGAAGSNVAGGLGSLVQSAAVNVLQSLAVTRVKELADSIQGDPATRETVRAALQAVVGCAGAAAGGSNGCGSAAAGAAASVVLNNLLSTGTTTATDKDGNPLTLEDQQARTNLVATLIAGIAGAVGANVNAATTSAIIETQNNGVNVPGRATPVVIPTRQVSYTILGLARDYPQLAAEFEAARENGESDESIVARYGAYVACGAAPVGQQNCAQDRDLDRLGVAFGNAINAQDTKLRQAAEGSLTAALNPSRFLPVSQGGGAPLTRPSPSQINFLLDAGRLAGVPAEDLPAFINFLGGVSNIGANGQTPAQAGQAFNVAHNFVALPATDNFVLSRSFAYGSLDASLNSRGSAYRTNFFGAAEDVTDTTGLTLAQFGSSLVGNPYSGTALDDIRALGLGLYRDVNRPTYEALYRGNGDFMLSSGVSLRNAGAGNTQSLDYALVRSEQTYVQNFLDGLPPARRANLIAQSNAALNGRAGQFFSPDIAEAARLLGRPINFANQSDRELIGRITVNMAAKSRQGR